MFFDYPPQEAVDLFLKRTDHHIELVKNNIYLFQESDKYNLIFDELTIRSAYHDTSKYREPELTPYIWRTWQSHCVLNNIPFDLPIGMDQKIRDAIFHHITHNRHHPEWWDDPDNMTKVDIIEMVCDWKALSQEMGEKSPIDYANRVLGRRFHFSQEKCDYIKKIIIELDEMCEEEEKAKQRLKEITPSNEELLKMANIKKHTFTNEYFDFIIIEGADHHHPMSSKEFDLIFKVSKKDNVTQPAVSREELKNLADFIYEVIK